MKSGIYLAFFIVLLYSSCSEQQYTVKGRSTQSVLDGEYAYMSAMYGIKSPTIDSCRIVHGRFEMSGPIDSVQCVVLSMGDNSIPMVMETGEVDIRFQNSAIEISGTPLNDKFYQFLRSRDSLMLIRSDIHEHYNDMLRRNQSYEDARSYLSTHLSLNNAEMDSLEYIFVSENFTNVLGVTWFLQMGEKASMRTGYYTSTPIMEALYNSAPSEFRENTEIKGFLNHCKSKHKSSEYKMRFNIFRQY